MLFVEETLFVQKDWNPDGGIRAFAGEVLIKLLLYPVIFSFPIDELPPLVISA